MPEPTRVVDAADRQRFELLTGDRVAGYVTYSVTGGRIVLLHIEFEPEYQGQGLGNVLARGILDDVRDRGVQVVPRCPFMAKWIRRNPEYDDLVDHQMLEKLGPSS